MIGPHDQAGRIQSADAPARAGAPAVPVSATLVAPHVRDAMSLAGVMRWAMVALVPCVATGLFNTGRQANLALASLGDEAPASWRAEALAGLGAGTDPGSAVSAILHGALYALPIFLVALLVGAAWEQVFARMRGRRTVPGCLLTALVFTLVLPPAAPLWQVALGASFGTVLGKEIFGGTGRTFLNPALVGLAFLYFSYPTELVGDPVWSGLSGYAGTSAFAQIDSAGLDALADSGVTWWASFLGIEQGALGVTSVLACLAGAAILIWGGVASWRIMAGTLIGMVVTAEALRMLFGDVAPALAVPWYWHLVLGSFAFGAVFLATDPASAATTDAGRWFFGLLVGAMVVFVRAANPAHPDGVLLAVILGNICAPLIDWLVVRANVRRRRARIG